MWIHSVSGFKWIQSQKQLTKMSKLRDMWQATQYIVVNQQKKSYGYLACPAIVAMKARKGNKNISNKVQFDSDSKRILTDNCASYSISRDKEDFVGDLQPVRRQIRGIGGTLGDVQKGSIIWWIEDDDGCPHKIILPGSLYIPTLPSRLLSPQHWAQVAHDEYPIPNGTHCITYADRIVLKWNQLRYQRMVQLCKEMGNVGKMCSSPGYTAYHSFAQDATIPPGTKVLTAVWAMKQKRRIDTREIYKWKARLNIDGSHKEKEINYLETFLPVA
jgi:hypothetical protein